MGFPFGSSAGFEFERLPYVPQRPLPDVLLPLQLDPNNRAPARYLIGAARLKPGVALTGGQVTGSAGRFRYAASMAGAAAADGDACAAARAVT
jgi:hypothetical protein